MGTKYNPQNETAVCDGAGITDGDNDDRPSLTDEQRSATRRIVAQGCVRQGWGRAELTEMMLMLGIYPGQETEAFTIDPSRHEVHN